jgi:general stress protein 26
MISKTLADFLQSPVSVLVGSRDAQRVPEAMRSAGMRVSADGTRFSLYLPVAGSARTVANLRDNGRVAVTVSRPHDNRSVQVKGTVTALREGDEADRVIAETYRAQYGAGNEPLGIPLAISLRFKVFPCFVVEAQVTELYEQTPGPNAGAPYGA